MTIDTMAPGYILTIAVDDPSQSLIKISGTTNMDRFAQVVAVGPAHPTEFGAIVPVPCDAKEGDIVFHTGAMSTEVMRDQAYKAIPFSQIICTVKDL